MTEISHFQKQGEAIVSGGWSWAPSIICPGVENLLIRPWVRRSKQKGQLITKPRPQGLFTLLKTCLDFYQPKNEKSQKWPGVLHPIVEIMLGELKIWLFPFSRKMKSGKVTNIFSPLRGFLCWNRLKFVNISGYISPKYIYQSSSHFFVAKT